VYDDVIDDASPNISCVHRLPPGRQAGVVLTTAAACNLTVSADICILSAGDSVGLGLERKHSR